MFTGLLMIGSTITLLAMGRWDGLEFDARDKVFLFLAWWVATSVAIDGFWQDPRDLCLLVLTLLAYPAGRLFSGDVLSRGFIGFLSAVTTAGVLACAKALLEQWNDLTHGKAMVFGEYDAAPAQFSMLFGFLLLAVTAKRLTWRRAAVVAGLSAIAAFVFAACQVRWTLIAIPLALCVAIAIANRRRQRIYIAAILVAFCGGVISGGLGRSNITKLYVEKAVESFAPQEQPDVLAPQTKPDVVASQAETATSAPVQAPSEDSCAGIDQKNSIEIRKRLLRDGIALLPEAGMSGIGFNRFLSRTCLQTQMHNTPLQVFVEFGFLGGALFLALIIMSAGPRMYHFGRINPEARFAMASVIFAVLIDLAHGRFNQDIPLFLLLGYAASLSSRYKSFAMRWLHHRVKALGYQAHCR